MDLPPEYDAYVGWLSWMGEISTGLIMPESCVGNAYQRLLLAGLMPVVILGLVVLWAVGRRLAQCVRIRASERRAQALGTYSMHFQLQSSKFKVHLLTGELNPFQ